MTRFEILRDASSNLLRSKRLWLIQFVANPLLFAAFAGWLLLPVATHLHLLLNGVVIIALVAAALILHGGTLRFYSDQGRTQQALARDAFRRAARNILAVAACVVLLFVLWALLDSTEHQQISLPFYLRSLLPEFIRSHFDLWWFQIAVEGMAFAIRWVVIPGLLLPLLLESTGAGFHAFGKSGRAAVRNSARQISYWIALLVAAFAGCIAPAFLMDWVPQFTNPTLRVQTLSLIARITVGYTLAVASWLLVCSIVRTRQPAAPGCRRRQ